MISLLLSLLCGVDIEGKQAGWLLIYLFKLLNHVLVHVDVFMMIVYEEEFINFFFQSMKI
jgi:hypothetical protein